MKLYPQTSTQVASLLLVSALTFGAVLFTVFDSAPTSSESPTAQSNQSAPGVASRVPTPAAFSFAAKPAPLSKTREATEAAWVSQDSVRLPTSPEVTPSISREPRNAPQALAKPPVSPKLESPRFAAHWNLPRSGFAPLPLPGLQIEQNGVAVTDFSPPAVLAPNLDRLPLDPDQRAGIEALADEFVQQVGEAPAAGMADARSGFSVGVYIATTEADFLIKQRFGHRAYVQMQMEAFRAAYVRQHGP